MLAGLEPVFELELALHPDDAAMVHDMVARAREGVGEFEYEHRAVIGGDAKSAAIAAASVIAKETRDRYMRRADADHPGFEFAQHVGYSTPEHREAIERLGLSPLHRLSFQSTAYQQLAL